ncbi:GDSL esterase/lipase 5-like [Pistacia vera]|uniref:GDSL esterase/lipase 5-like n=1 Tax=Pistacia vera TaxID=55513 RepID=UPI001263B3DF|nr:GDSL esterase/lipase 5-like [Pistacia vera]
MNFNMTRSRVLLCFLILCSSLLIPGHCHRSLPKKHVALFIFGDSLFDAGNNNYINTTTHSQANFWPYGESFFKYPTGRFSDGRLISDFIAERAGLPFIPTFLPSYNDKFVYGVNFASAGGGALVMKRIRAIMNKVIDLQNSAELLQDCGEAVKQKLVMQKPKHCWATQRYKTGGRKFGLSAWSFGLFTSWRALVNGSSGSCLETPRSELAKLHNIESIKPWRSFRRAMTACCGSGPYRGISSCGGKRGIEEYELCDILRNISTLTLVMPPKGHTSYLQN